VLYSYLTLFAPSIDIKTEKRRQSGRRKAPLRRATLEGLREAQLRTLRTTTTRQTKRPPSVRVSEGASGLNLSAERAPMARVALSRKTRVQLCQDAHGLEGAHV
jgi:hypothetical protein